MAAGSTDHAPLPVSISIDGMSSDQTEAAIITPEAKPNNDFCSLGDMSFFMKKTKAAPSMVPSIGINKPIVIPIIIPLLFIAANVFYRCKDK